MIRILAFLLALFFITGLAADYITSGIGLGLRATSMLFKESRDRKKEAREAELHQKKLEKEYLEESGLKELDKILKFRYRLKLYEVDKHPLFWKYAEKTMIRKDTSADQVIMKHIEKKEFAQAAAVINRVVARMKKDGKWKKSDK